MRKLGSAIAIDETEIRIVRISVGGFLQFVPTIRVDGILRLVLVLALLGLSACGSKEKEKPTAFGELRWPSLPVTLKADKLLLDRTRSDKDLRAAISFWESRAGKTLFLLSDWPTGQPPYTGAAINPDTLLENAIYFQSPWPFESQIAGKTFIHSEGTSITHAVVFLNAGTDLCDEDCKSDGDGDRTSRQKLIAHELGHFLGLNHVNDKDNIMYPEIVQGGDLESAQVDMALLTRLTQ